MAAWLAVAVLASACGEPPNKEMDQAQAAIDAARVAGADRFAAADYDAARAALREAHEAVTQRDFRQALNHALESRERAQAAGRAADEARARLRGEAGTAAAGVTALLSDLASRVKSSGARLAPARAREARRLLDQAPAELQEVGRLIEDDDFAEANARLTALKSRIAAQIAALDARRAGAAARRRR